MAPAVLYWGSALGEVSEDLLRGLATAAGPAVPHSALDRPRRRGLVGETSRGFTGAPALEGFRVGGPATAAAPQLSGWFIDLDDAGPDAILRVEAGDPEAGWLVGVDLELTRDGVARLRTSVTSCLPGVLHLTAVRSALPVPAQGCELLDLTGRWCRERTPQRRPWLIGTHLREARHGRTGHDANLLMAAGRPGFGFGHGEVWATHLAWSGDHATYAERTPEGECVLGGGELLAPGEVALDEGESYVGPWLLGAYGAAGLDDASARLHAWTRRQAIRSRAERPVVVNTWEASYFDHDLERLSALAAAAAEVGAERFVLDDGWFEGRRHDRVGLGDWTVDETIWPDGLGPLIERVHGLGLDFGLWVEPEMINEDSALARAHPDWILRGRTALPDTWRHQQVLDLQVPGAYDYVRAALLALLDAYDIAFLKWDHNRDLIDVTHGGRPAVHGQTLALYRLLDELRAAHPDLGGGRIDLEILTRTDRVWPSDTIDAQERQQIQRWTSLVVPPEMMGVHVGGPVAHTTGRSHPLGYRAATALLGHLGIEWDLASITPAQRDELTAWIALHKRLRPTLSSGRSVRGDHPDPAVVLSGIVSVDRDEAWFVVATTDSLATQAPTPLLLPGLDESRAYRVDDVTPAGRQHRAFIGDTWLDGDGIVIGGSALTRVGLQLPPLAPESALVLHAVAEAPR
ncbi:alpha-galactosidase [Nocardioides sp.]|uniref:alpha-galactosidase n=1 Tax=Nocardioides sp. TaxID=35761 RepID=UPI002B278249|nr:alpha-galactosidase [Nocardioides sp.]